ncbi:MAG: cytochrome P450 [Haloferacaceae archaeon]
MRPQPPGPKGLPVVGNARRYARDPFSFLDACAEAYGDVISLRFGPMDAYAVTNPDEIERILVTEAATFRKPSFRDDAVEDLLGDGLLLSEGERWRRQRDLAQPAFAMSRITELDGLMTDRTLDVVADWRDGDVVDVEGEMARLTVSIIVEAMFGTSLTDEQVETVHEHLEPLGARFEPDPLRFLLPNWTPTRENREYRRAVRALEGVLDEVVAERRGTEFGDGGDQPTDLLSILLRAQARGEQSEEQLRDELMTMLLAGHDTTALTLTYAWLHLSAHPNVEARVHEELAGVVAGDVPTAGEARRLSYVERVLQETMRVDPPVYTLFREPEVDVRVGGYRIPEGAAVMLPQWVVHRSPRWWDDPETFDPDRFLPARSGDRPRYAYFPFGAGPRHCIGKQFSMLEAKLVLGTIAERFRLTRADSGPLERRGSLTMHPKEPPKMRLHAR